MEMATATATATAQHLHYQHNSFPPPPFSSSSSSSAHFDAYTRLGAEGQSEASSEDSPGPSSNIVPPRVAAIRPQPKVLYRAIQPSDLPVLQTLHEGLFPIKYEPDFFSSVVYGRGIVAWGAVDAEAPEALIGFVTARVGSVSESQQSEILGHEFTQSERQLIYILTLGVTKPYRNFGVASKLLRKVIDYASSCPMCRAVYLHVIAYNRAAILFYRKNLFRALRTLPGFYYIAGRYYDAHLCVFYVNGGRPPFSTLDIIGSTSSFLRSIFTNFVERWFARQEDDDGKGAKWPRVLDLWASIFTQSYHQRISDASSTCPCV